MFELRPTNALEKVVNRVRFHKRYASNRLVPRLTPEQEAMVSKLRRDGFVLLENFVSPAALSVMQEEIDAALRALDFQTPCLAQSRIDAERHAELIRNYLYVSDEKMAEMGLSFGREEAHSLEQVVRDFNPSTLTVYMLEYSEHYRRVWLDENLLAVVSSYLGLVPHLAEAYVRRNYPSPFRTMNHYWHRDLNGRHYLLKIFVFLSDCTVENGPHEFIRGSHKRFDLLNGKRYFTDQEVDAAYPPHGPDRDVGMVKAGTVIIEDTRGLHRAQMPNVGFRDLGYAVFVPFTEGSQTANYKFPRAGWESLTDFQRAFIPRGCLS